MSLACRLASDEEYGAHTWHAAVLAPLLRSDKIVSEELQSSASPRAITPTAVKPLEASINVRRVLFSRSAAAIAMAPASPILHAIPCRAAFHACQASLHAC
jgi:hypothetical protein